MPFYHKVWAASIDRVYSTWSCGVHNAEGGQFESRVCNVDSIGVMEYTYWSVLVDDVIGCVQAESDKEAGRIERLRGADQQCH